jgi:hypothetical protein
MDDWVRRALRRKVRNVQVEANETVVYGVKFAMGMTGCLTAIEIANMAFLHTWNSDVFTAISGLIGLVTGIFIGHRA